MSTSATSRDDVRSSSTVQANAYFMEHALAWLATVGAIVLGILGLLIGFGLITGAMASANTGDIAGAASAQYWSASLWLLTGIACAVLAFAMHRTEHHFRMDPNKLDAGNRRMFFTEHYLSWLAAAGAIAVGIIAYIIGYGAGWNIFSGLMWALASIGLAGISAALHNTGHHQMAEREDYIVSVVERRVGTPMATRPIEGTVTRPTYEGPTPPRS